MPTGKPRLVHVLGNLNYGGLQSLVLNLIEELPSFAHTAVVLSTQRGPLYPGYLKACEVVECDYPRGQTVAFFLRLTRLFRDLKPDIVSGHLFGNHTLVSWAAALTGVPTTYGVSHNDPVFFARSRWKPMLLAHLARPFCQGEIAVSESVARVLGSRLRLPARRVRVILNGCPVEVIAARAATVATHPPRLLMVANLGRGKDHSTAVRAIDIVIHLSDSEGLSIAMIEAMAAGVPLIASDIPSCREVLDGGRCGMLIPRGDEAALAAAIGRILDEAPLRRQLVRAAAERVRSRYHLRHMAAGYLELLTGAARPPEAARSR